MKKLYLSDDDKKLAGVCGGLGEYLDVDSTLIRVAWIALTVFTAIIPGIIAYILMAIIMPHRPIHE